MRTETTRTKGAPARHALADPRAAVRVSFPGARLARIEDAPPRCPNCGGPWRRLLTSVACMICPTELYAVAELNRVETGAVAVG